MEMISFSRRAILKGGALVAAGSFIPAFARRALAEESAGPARKALVFLFLRGALDGLHAVPPTEEPRLFDLRPQMALPKSDLLEIGAPGFAFHPSLAPLVPAWREGALAVVHAVGSPDATRSHFDAQDYLELGTPGVKGTPDGWLARSLRESQRGGTFEAVAVSPRLPRSLQGAPGALAFASLDQLRLRPLPGAAGQKGERESRETFAAMYEGNSGNSGTRYLIRELERVHELSIVSPKLRGEPLAQLAALIKADVGLRVGAADLGGWDTHTAQPGQLANNLQKLAQALAAFREDLGPRKDDVVLIAATEFGRTVRQNGANGTDHGHASIALVLGGGVRGGRIHGQWPGLRDDRLFEGRDLAVTTDLRSVLAAAAGAQLGVSDVQKLFPGFAGAPLPGLFS